MNQLNQKKHFFGGGGGGGGHQIQIKVLSTIKNYHRYNGNQISADSKGKNTGTHVSHYVTKP